MDFHKLQNQFWQLYAVERFSGNVALLYFYWLNRFNTGFNGKFWPAEYPRWSKQVEADLGITDKPLATARKVLEQRGLLYYLEGSKSKAPIWSLSPIVRKNSGQYEGISRINSDESESIAPHISRNNSGQLTGLPPALAGETPDSIRRRHKPVLEQEDTNKKNAVAGADFSEAITALSESKRITAPNPIALPPSPILGTMESCMEQGTEESQALAMEMAAYWLIPEGKNSRRWAQFATFTCTLAAAGRLAEVRTNFEAYQRYQQLRGISRFAVDKYLGHELEGYSDGEWCGCKWPELLAEALLQHANKNNHGPAPAPVSAGGTPSKRKTDW